MLAFSIRLLFRKRVLSEELVNEEGSTSTSKCLKQFSQSVALGISSPATISIFIAGTSMLKIFPNNLFESFALTFIVWFASSLWYAGMVFLITLIRKRASLNFVQYLNLTSILFLVLISGLSLIHLF